MRRKNKNKNKFQNYKYQLKSSKWKEIRKYCVYGAERAIHIGKKLVKSMRFKAAI